MLEFQRGFFSISNLLCICIIHSFDIWAPFAFLHFTTVNFPVQTRQVPGVFLLVCEIFGLGLVWSCGGDGGDVFFGCCLSVGSSVVLSLGLCLWLLWELLVLVRSVVSKKRVMV
jgi:hypothetical protein